MGAGAALVASMTSSAERNGVRYTARLFGALYTVIARGRGATVCVTSTDLEDAAERAMRAHALATGVVDVFLAAAVPT